MLDKNHSPNKVGLSSNQKRPSQPHGPKEVLSQSLNQALATRLVLFTSSPLTEIMFDDILLSFPFCSPIECQIQEGCDFVFLSTHPQHLEECLAHSRCLRNTRWMNAWINKQPQGHIASWDPDSSQGHIPVGTQAQLSDQRLLSFAASVHSFMLCVCSVTSLCSIEENIASFPLS